jgi:hypothetical protein
MVEVSVPRRCFLNTFDILITKRVATSREENQLRYVQSYFMPWKVTKASFAAFGSHHDWQGGRGGWLGSALCNECWRIGMSGLLEEKRVWWKC